MAESSRALVRQDRARPACPRDFHVSDLRARSAATFGATTRTRNRFDGPTAIQGIALLPIQLLQATSLRGSNKTPTSAGTDAVEARFKIEALHRPLAIHRVVLRSKLRDARALGNGRYARNRPSSFAACRLPFMPRFLQDSWNLGVGNQTLPALLIPVETTQTRPSSLDRERRSPPWTRALSLLIALGREDFQKAIEIFDVRRCEYHFSSPLWDMSLRSCDFVANSDCRNPACLNHLIRNRTSEAIQGSGSSPVFRSSPI